MDEMDIQTPIITTYAFKADQAKEYIRVSREVRQDGRDLLVSAELFANMLLALAEGMIES